MKNHDLNALLRLALVTVLIASSYIQSVEAHSAPFTSAVLSERTAFNSTIQAAATSLAGGWLHICAVTIPGGLKCWGANFSGQLGDGTNVERHTPVDVTGLTSGVLSVASGASYTCALTVAGGVKCWGDNSSGQLGNGTFSSSNTAVDVVGLTSGVKAIAAGGSHTCALTTSGGMKCWGANEHGQLGDTTTTIRNAPVDVTGLTSGVTAVATGTYHTCAITNVGGVKCWGWNYTGQVGDGTVIERHSQVDVVSLSSGVSLLAIGGYHTCALTTGGGVKCWGNNFAGQLGDGTNNLSVTPVSVIGLSSGVLKISSGTNYGSYNCAVVSGGSVKCWGFNSLGQIGDGTTTNRASPTNVIGLNSAVIALSMSDNHTCAVTGSGSVKCWGSNDHGQLGDGTTTNRLTPVDVVGLGGNPVVTESRLDIGMPYDANRGCPSPYAGCGGPYHGFYRGVCTDLVLDAYRAGASTDLQNALTQDHQAHPDHYYEYLTARWAPDLNRYFSYNQYILQFSQIYQPGDIAFFSWQGTRTDHVVVISEVDTNGHPTKMVDASGVILGNPSGRAFEHSWTSYYDQHVEGHARLPGVGGAVQIGTVVGLQMLQISIDNPEVKLRLFDANGKSTSENYDENLIASNVEAFVPYIPGGMYTDLGTIKLITVTQPLSNTSQYVVEVQSQANTTYHLNIQTLQDFSVTASQIYTQTIGISETQSSSIAVSAPSGTIQFSSTALSTAPQPALPDELTMTGLVDTSTLITFTVAESGGQQPITGIALSSTDLTDQLGEIVPGASISLSPSGFTVSAGASQSVAVQVSLASIQPAEYLGSLIVTSQTAAPQRIRLILIVLPHVINLPLIMRN